MILEIKYDKLGKILEGDNAGWHVKIINDQSDTGGFFIYEFEYLNGEKGYDTWLETDNDVKAYIYESNWKINWLLENQ